MFFGFLRFLPLFLSQQETFGGNIFITTFDYRYCVALGQVWRYWYNNICELKGFLYSLASEEEDLSPWFNTYMYRYIKFHNNLLNNIYPLYQLINYEILSYIEHNKHYNSNNCTIEKTFKIHVID